MSAMSAAAESVVCVILTAVCSSQDLLLFTSPSSGDILWLRVIIMGQI